MYPPRLPGNLPQVSVVVATYNPGLELIDAIESVLYQTHPPSEIVLVDDGSDQNGKAIIKRAIKRCSDCSIVLLINERNLGLTISLIRGVARTTFGLVARIDADDLWMKNHLQLSIDALLRSGCGLVGCSFVNKTPPNRIADINGFDIITKPLIKNPFFHSSVLFHKHVYNIIGGYSEVFAYSQDFELWTRFQRSGVGIARLASCTVCIGNSANGISNTKRRKQALFAIRAIYSTYGFTFRTLAGIIWRLSLYYCGSLRRLAL